jgi:hypothetical protein
MGLEGAGILYTILLILEMILLKVLGSEGKVTLVEAVVVVVVVVMILAVIGRSSSGSSITE